VKSNDSDIQFEIEILRRPIPEKQKQNRKKTPVDTLPTGWQQFETVFGVSRDSSGAHHSLNPVIKLNIRHPRKKERKNF